MVLVRGHDTYSALQITTKPNTDAWGTIATSPSWETVPTLGEGLVVRPFAFPKSQELGNTGEVTSYSQGRQFIEGEFTVYPRYNAPWFWKLIGNAFGGVEERVADKTVAGDIIVGTFSSHIWAPQSFQCATDGSESGVASGLSLRVWKSGDTTSGYVDKIAGATVTGFTWNQPEDDLPTVTFRILGTAPTSSVASGEGSLVAAATAHQVKVRDLSRTGYTYGPSLALMGPSLSNTQNVRAFSISLDGNYELGAAFLNDPDTVEKPGHADSWSVTGEVVGLIEQTIGATAQPYKDFTAGNASALRVRYASDQTVITTPSTVYYNVDMIVPELIITAAEATTSSGGANATRYSFEGYRDTLPSTTSNFAELWKVPLYMQTHLSDTEDSSGVLLTASHGGNNLNTDLELV